MKYEKGIVKVQSNASAILGPKLDEVRNYFYYHL